MSTGLTTSPPSAVLSQTHSAKGDPLSVLAPCLELHLCSESENDSALRATSHVRLVLDHRLQDGLKGRCSSRGLAHKHLYLGRRNTRSKPCPFIPIGTGITRVL